MLVSDSATNWHVALPPRARHSWRACFSLGLSLVGGGSGGMFAAGIGGQGPGAAVSHD